MHDSPYKTTNPLIPLGLGALLCVAAYNQPDPHKPEISEAITEQRTQITLPGFVTDALPQGVVDKICHSKKTNREASSWHFECKQ